MIPLYQSTKLPNHESYTKKHNMNQDLFNDSPETRCHDDKLPSQSLTKSERNEPPHQNDYEELPLPYTFSPERVQHLYSSTRYIPHDYSDERHQRPYPTTDSTVYRHSSSDNFPERSSLHSYEPYYDAHRYTYSTPAHATGQQNIASYSYSLHEEANQCQRLYSQYPSTSSSTYYSPSPSQDNAMYLGRYAMSPHYPNMAPINLMTGHGISYDQSYLPFESGGDRLLAIKESEINENDVRCGRGGLTNTHIGNRNFRTIVKEYQEQYVMAKKKLKPQVAEMIFKKIRAMTPPGRFIKKDKASGMWFAVGDDKAIEKTCQALREGTSKVRSRIDSIKTSSDNAEVADFDHEGQQSSDEDKKRSREEMPQLPPALLGQVDSDHSQVQAKEGGQYYISTLPDPYVPSQLLSFDDIGETVISQSPIRMSESWDVYQSPIRRKRPKSNSNSPELPLDGNLFIAPHSSQVNQCGVKREEDKRPQSKSV